LLLIPSFLSRQKLIKLFEKTFASVPVLLEGFFIAWNRARSPTLNDRTIYGECTRWFDLFVAVTRLRLFGSAPPKDGGSGGSGGGDGLSATERWLFDRFEGSADDRKLAARTEIAVRKVTSN
jgi:hypothetical protein